MGYRFSFKRTILFPLLKIIIGIALIVGSAAIGEWLRSAVFEKYLKKELAAVIVVAIQIVLALSSYILFFRYCEKRKISELSAKTFLKNSLIGFLLGLGIQSLTIAVLYVSGGYSIGHINPVSFLVPGFISALTAGFIAELILRGVFFRIVEEKLGSPIAIIVSVLLFVIMHSGAEGASFLSVSSTAIQTGLLYSLTYVYSRSLWLPIFLHFSWDFAEPAIYGGVNPGMPAEKTWFAGNITGPASLTGGVFGPGHSLQSLIFCLAASLIFFWLAKQKNNFIKPYWKEGHY